MFAFAGRQNERCACWPSWHQQSPMFRTSIFLRRSTAKMRAFWANRTAKRCKINREQGLSPALLQPEDKRFDLDLAIGRRKPYSNTTWNCCVFVFGWLGWCSIPILETKDHPPKWVYSKECSRFEQFFFTPSCELLESHPKMGIVNIVASKKHLETLETYQKHTRNLQVSMSTSHSPQN